MAEAMKKLVLENLTHGNNSDTRNSHGWLSRGFQNRLLSQFENLELGSLCVRDGAKSWQLGTPCLDARELHANIAVNQSRFYRRILFGGTIGSAESFVDGDWDTDDLTAVIRIFVQNISRVKRLENSSARLLNLLHFGRHMFRRNTRQGSRKNIGEHYDLGNDFYSLFLDPSMNYSSGIFPDSESSMLDASLNKMQWIGEKLRLTPDDHLLEIGTGWGGLAIYLAQNFGCRVTTTTISREQFRYAKANVEKAGLQDRVTLLLKDYRDLDGEYDKLVSIEMIEAVGHQFYDDYFRKCASLLNESGLMLIQAITMGHQDFGYHIRHVDFIRRYIFPGGCLPSIVALGDAASRSTNLRPVHLEDITSHYVTTLQHWSRDFHLKMDRIRELGYDQEFIRMWHFYLCYCKAAFAEKRVRNVQLMFAKPGCDIDPANEFSKPQRMSRSDSSEARPSRRPFSKSHSHLVESSG